MRVLSGSTRIAIVCGVVALTIGGAALAARLSTVGWTASGLPRVAARSGLGRLAHRIDSRFHTVRHGAYDGQFYWGIAIDPVASGEAHHYFDKASYRYGHPLYGWLGWLVSLGEPAAAPAALVCIGLLSFVAAASVACALPVGTNVKWLAGLVVAFTPGLIYALIADLAEPLAAFALLGALYAHSRRCIRLEWLCLALLPLAKEQLVVVLGATVMYRLIEKDRGEAAVFSLAVVPALAWWIVARIRVGAWFTTGTSALGLPFVGWRAAFHQPAAAVFLALLLSLFTIAAIRALRRRDLVDLVYLGLAAVALCLASNATLSFTTALRNTAFLTVLLPLVLVGDREQAAA